MKTKRGIPEGAPPGAAAVQSATVPNLDNNLSENPAAPVGMRKGLSWGRGLMVLVGLAGVAIVAGATAGASSKMGKPGSSESKGMTASASSSKSNSGDSGAEIEAQASSTNLAAAAVNSMETLDDKHRLAIGDRLSFRIVEDEEDPKPLLVTDSGELELPYIGRFPAVGKTCKAVAREIKTELEKEYYYDATVIVAVDLKARSLGKVYLVGPVRSSGPQEIPSDETFTLSKAILRAGGFGDFADKHSVRVTRKGRGGEKTFTVDVAQILEKGKTDLDITLEPGDFIYIPERVIRF